MSIQHAPRYPLGSQRRWLTSLVLLPLPAGLAGLVLWVWDREVALFFIAPVFVGLLWISLDSESEEDPDWHFPWFTDIEANLAHGSADDGGIHFRKWFRWHFVRWKGIERVVFWPDKKRAA